MKTMPSLLAPAGNMRALQTALRFGADAPFIVAPKQYGLRAQAGNFDEKQLEQAVTLAHAAGAQVNLTLNIFAFDGDLDGMVRTGKGGARHGCGCGDHLRPWRDRADCAGGAGTGYSRKHAGEHDEQRIRAGYTRRWGRSASCWRRENDVRTRSRRMSAAVRAMKSSWNRSFTARRACRIQGGACCPAS